MRCSTAEYSRQAKQPRLTQLNLRCVWSCGLGGMLPYPRSGQATLATVLSVASSAVCISARLGMLPAGNWGTIAIMRFGRFLALLSAAFVALMLVSVDFAEARRGGSFGSRGFRTQQAVPPTRTAPNQTGPVERSMTPNVAARQQQAMGQRPGLFSGMGGGLMRGMLLGGLLGMLLGYGFGGMAGALGFLVQLLVVGGLIWLAMAFLRARSQPAVAGGPPAGAGDGAPPATAGWLRERKKAIASHISPPIMSSWTRKPSAPAMPPKP